MKRAIVCAGLVAAVLFPGAASAQSEATIRTGQEIAGKFCARCHAIGIKGKSNHPSAPPFRDIVAKGNVQNLEEALGEGIVVGHPDMPQFQFGPHEVGALIAYLKSLSGKG
ncbi:MAG: c-type cytochrome [Rhodomicrobium sp.]